MLAMNAAGGPFGHSASVHPWRLEAANRMNRQRNGRRSNISPNGRLRRRRRLMDWLSAFRPRPEREAQAAPKRMA